MACPTPSLPTPDGRPIALERIAYDETEEVKRSEGELPVGELEVPQKVQIRATARCREPGGSLSLGLFRGRVPSDHGSRRNGKALRSRAPVVGRGLPVIRIGDVGKVPLLGIVRRPLDQPRTSRSERNEPKPQE